MAKPAPARRRRAAARAAAAMPAMPLWKRILGAVLFAAGGGACAAWGVYGTAAWLVSLHRGDGVIETESVILGLPLLGGSLAVIGLAFLLPASVTVRFEELCVRIVGVLLGATVVGIVLLPLGALVINVTMEARGYRACDVRGRGRVTDVTWAGTGAECPPH